MTEGELCRGETVTEPLQCRGVTVIEVAVRMKRPHQYSAPETDSEELIDVGQEDGFCPVTGSQSLTTTSQTQAKKRRRGIIEKRRRDRINHSLSELRRLVPSAFEKQGSSKLEKAEILQMTVDHLKLLHAMGGKGYLDAHALAVDYRSLGFRECVGEVARFLSSLESLQNADPIGTRLVAHLSHCASEMEPLLPSPASLPHPHPWPWDLPQLSSTFPRRGSEMRVPRRDVPPPPTTALLAAYPSPMGCLPTTQQGGAMAVQRIVPMATLRGHGLSHPGNGLSPALHHPRPTQLSFRAFAPFSASPSSPPSSGAAQPSRSWGTEIGAF